MPLDDFRFSTLSEPHRSRARAILQAHPEIRHLIGRNPRTALVIVAVTAAQVALAVGAGRLPWAGVVAVAWVIGAFFAHGLFVLMHECTHSLVFQARALNFVTGIVANLPNVMPSAASVHRYHLKHHSFQGVHELDVDMPSRWEARAVGTSPWRKALWLLCFPLFMSLRPVLLKEIRWLSAWNIINIVVVVAFDLAVVLLFGPKAFAYLLLSVFFGMGLHPLGARWIQEHFTLHPPQETYSYYGPLNRVAFNIGYHNEHHDFPAIPWNRLPQLRRAAPEYYDPQVAHRSWTRLLLRFLLDREITLYSRMRRTNRGHGATMDALVTRPA